jgi:hypothetical protein
MPEDSSLFKKLYISGLLNIQYVRAHEFPSLAGGWKRLSVRGSDEHMDPIRIDGTRVEGGKSIYPWYWITRVSDRVRHFSPL